MKGGFPGGRGALGLRAPVLRAPLATRSLPVRPPADGSAALAVRAAGARAPVTPEGGTAGAARGRDAGRGRGIRGAGGAGGGRAQPRGCYGAAGLRRPRRPEPDYESGRGPQSGLGSPVPEAHQEGRSRDEPE